MRTAVARHVSPRRSLDKKLIRDLLALENSDAGNAAAFELMHGERFRYNHTSGKWLIWNGQFWIEDRDGEALRATLVTIRCRQMAAVLMPESKKKDMKIKRRYSPAEG